jgi:hypothetical protein
VLDCALLMRDVPVTWNPLPPMLAADAVAAHSCAGRGGRLSRPGRALGAAGLDDAALPLTAAARVMAAG